MQTSLNAIYWKGQLSEILMNIIYTLSGGCFELHLHADEIQPIGHIYQDWHQHQADLGRCQGSVSIGVGMAKHGRKEGVDYCDSAPKGPTHTWNHC